MTCPVLLAEGARNLLTNCAQLSKKQTLLIIREDPALGWYDAEAATAIASEARKLGVLPCVMDVDVPLNHRDWHISQAINAHDVTIFLARVGDQERFAEPIPGKKNIMCYARDADTLASSYGRTDHKALIELRQAVNEILVGARTIEITCPLGTHLTGPVAAGEMTGPCDVSVQRFPIGVPQPLCAAGLSGKVALARYLSPTGSRIYDPPWIPIEGTVFAHVKRGRISEFTGDQDAVENVQEHHRKVAETFGIDGNIVHSFHAGLHPASLYRKGAGDNPDLWSNSVFTNPRVLHFHVCGDYAPGEISWVVIDHTLAVDGRALWENGRLCIEGFAAIRTCMNNWPDLKSLFDDPVMEIGL